MKRTDVLRVYETRLSKVRLGRDHDGGYVVAILPMPYDHFLSGGIADDNSFERAVLDAHPYLMCDAFDPNSDGGPHSHERLRFNRAPVGYLGLHDAREALVKLDVEGAEWPWLEELSDFTLDNVAQLVVELHSPHGNLWSWGLLSRLARSHSLVHAHGNNWDGIVEIDGVKMPGTIETTWVRHDLAQIVGASHTPIPGPLDMPNVPTTPDHVIDWPPFCEAL